MGRPVKPRKISLNPKYKFFRPKGRTSEDMEVVIIKLEELEAIFLKDLEGKDQIESASDMEISRQTFQNIIEEARRKITDALVNGKGIIIEGGNYNYGGCEDTCKKCIKSEKCKFRPL